METFPALLAICAGNSPVTGEFPAQRPVTRSFDIFLDLRLNKRLSKQCWGWWFKTPSRSLIRHCNAEKNDAGWAYMQTDPFHKSHNAPDKYPTMLYFVTEICTRVYIFVAKWCIVIYGTSALWDLWDWSVPYHSLILDTLYAKSW